MKLAQTEVYEVATFYHHFDVVKEGETPPPPLTVRVCDSISCELAGAGELLAGLKRALGADVRVIPAPCVGRCEQAPVAVVGQNPVAHATVEKVEAAALQAKTTRCPVAQVHRLRRVPAGTAATGSPPNASPASATPRAIMKTMEDSGLRGLGGAGFPAGRKWRLVRPSRRRG